MQDEIRAELRKIHALLLSGNFQAHEADDSDSQETLTVAEAAWGRFATSVWMHTYPGRPAPFLSTNAASDSAQAKPKSSSAAPENGLNSDCDSAESRAPQTVGSVAVVCQTGTPTACHMDLNCQSFSCGGSDICMEKTSISAAVAASNVDVAEQGVSPRRARRSRSRRCQVEQVSKSCGTHQDTRISDVDPVVQEETDRNVLASEAPAQTVATIFAVEQTTLPPREQFDSCLMSRSPSLQSWSCSQLSLQMDAELSHLQSQPSTQPLQLAAITKAVVEAENAEDESWEWQPRSPSPSPSSSCRSMKQLSPPPHLHRSSPLPSSETVDADAAVVMASTIATAIG